jgi:acetylornithine/succinyldiaminopimelate/putrescine aminotransferase
MVGLLEAFDYGRCFVRATGTRLFDEEGREYTDFLSGFGVHNIGHNHPRLVGRLGAVLTSSAASMLNIDAPEVAGRLAERLTAATRPKLNRVVFANSGAEAVDAALRAARAAGGRTAVVACDNAYHGLSSAVLPLLGDEAVRRSLGVNDAGVLRVPHGDIGALAMALRERPAAFIVEPVAGEGGITTPSDDYLPQAAALCREHGVKLIIDEIQTGLGRCGALFAVPPELRPDALLVGKALSGGLIPVAAALMTEEMWRGTWSGPTRCQFATSTFAGNHLGMEAGTETLAIIAEEKLATRARETGARLRELLEEMARRHPIIRDVRGRGLLLGAVPAWARAGLFSQVICALLLSDHAVIAQPCSLRPAVLRVEPPLIVTDGECDAFVRALDDVLTKCPDHAAAVRKAAAWTLFGRRR